MCVILHFLGEWLSGRHLLRAFTSRNTIPSYFTILKSYSINYTIPFYNTSNIPKLYYFTILLKYYFLIVLGKHKKHFFIRPLSFFFIPSPSLSLSLSLSLLSGFDCAPVRASMRSWVYALVVNRGSWIVNLWYGFMGLCSSCDMGFC